MDSDNEVPDEVFDEDMEVNSDQDDFEKHVNMDDDDDDELVSRPKKIVKNKYEDDDAAFLSDAIAQISKLEMLTASQNSNNVTAESAGLNITTEGLSQDSYKNVNLAKIKDLLQCYWCGKYFSNEIVLAEKDGSVCKHCVFSVNHDESTRMAFDVECAKKGTGIALYIVECKDAHNTENCSRHPHCYLCDFKLGIPIKNILNPAMLGIDENGIGHKQEIVAGHNFSNIKEPQCNQCDQYERVEFLGSSDPSRKIKIPAKLVLK